MSIVHLYQRNARYHLCVHLYVCFCVVVVVVEAVSQNLYVHSSSSSVSTTVCLSVSTCCCRVCDGFSEGSENPEIIFTLARLSFDRVQFRETEIPGGGDSFTLVCCPVDTTSKNYAIYVNV